MKIKEMQKDQRPREKALRYGFQVLSDEEVLCLILCSGSSAVDVQKICQDIVKTTDQLSNIFELHLSQLTEIEGVGKAKALTVLACAEIARRSLRRRAYKTQIQSAQDVAEWLQAEYGSAGQEHFIVLFLDTKGNLIGHKVLGIGTLNQSVIHPRDIFREAYLSKANSILIAHNHPSGDPEPSLSDLECTRWILDASSMTGIPVLDHVIVTNSTVFSFKQHNLLYGHQHPETFEPSLPESVMNRLDASFWQEAFDPNPQPLDLFEPIDKPVKSRRQRKRRDRRLNQPNPQQNPDPQGKETDLLTASSARVSDPDQAGDPVRAGDLVQAADSVRTEDPVKVGNPVRADDHDQACDLVHADNPDQTSCSGFDPELQKQRGIPAGSSGFEQKARKQNFIPAASAGMEWISQKSGPVQKNHSNLSPTLQEPGLLPSAFPARPVNAVQGDGSGFEPALEQETNHSNCPARTAGRDSVDQNGKHSAIQNEKRSSSERDDPSRKTGGLDQSVQISTQNLSSEKSCTIWPNGHTGYTTQQKQPDQLQSSLSALWQELRPDSLNPEKNSLLPVLYKPESPELQEASPSPGMHEADPKGNSFLYQYAEYQSAGSSDIACAGCISAAACQSGNYKEEWS